MDGTESSARTWQRRSQWALWFNVISALWGGGFLVGGAEGYPISMLDDTPFDSFLIPGIILTFIVGGSSLLAAMAHIRKWSIAPELTLAAGAILVGWMLVEFIMIPEGWIPQLVWVVPGIFMLWGGYVGWKQDSRTPAK